MRARAVGGAIAASGLACDHRWAEQAFGLIVGDVQAGRVQEAEEMGALFAQALREAPIVRVGQLALRVNQPVQAPLELVGAAAKLPRGQGWLLVAQDERGPQDRCHVLGEANGAASFGLAQLAQVFEQVSETLLLKPGLQIMMVIEGWNSD
jgi:hypothetical protein